jgi:hypothetical protein
MNNYKINWKLINKENDYYKMDWNRINMVGGAWVNGVWIADTPAQQPPFISPQPPPQSQPQQYQPPPPPQQYQQPPPPQYQYQPPPQQYQPPPAQPPPPPVSNVLEKRFNKFESQFKTTIGNIQKQLYKIVDIQILNEKLTSIVQNKVLKQRPPPPPSEDDTPQMKTDFAKYKKFKTDSDTVVGLKLNKFRRQYVLLDYLKKNDKDFDVITITENELADLIQTNKEDLKTILKNPSITRENVIVSTASTEESSEENKENKEEEKKQE